MNGSSTSCWSVVVGWKLPSYSSSRASVCRYLNFSLSTSFFLLLLCNPSLHYVCLQLEAALSAPPRKELIPVLGHNGNNEARKNGKQQLYATHFSSRKKNIYTKLQQIRGLYWQQSDDTIHITIHVSWYTSCDTIHIMIHITRYNARHTTYQ